MYCISELANYMKSVHVSYFTASFCNKLGGRLAPVAH